jgi:seryl-tRNA(Sec) selenium transferase
MAFLNIEKNMRIKTNATLHKPKAYLAQCKNQLQSVIKNHTTTEYKFKIREMDKIIVINSINLLISNYKKIIRDFTEIVSNNLVEEFKKLEIEKKY